MGAGVGRRRIHLLLADIQFRRCMHKCRRGSAAALLPQGSGADVGGVEEVKRSVPEARLQKLVYEIKGH